MSAQARRRLLMERAAELAGQGRTLREAAEACGYSYTAMSALCSAAGIKFARQPGSGRKPGGHTCHSKRDEEFAERFKSGETLQQIANSHGITRERVRQVLAMRGVERTDGGSFVRTVKARKEAVSRRERECRAKYGCSLSDYRGLLALGRTMIANGHCREVTPVGAFRSQKAHAFSRGIEWQLTLWQWWTIWQESGRWEQRGRGSGYGMCRKGDAGPYSADNVYIAPLRHNSSSQARKKSGLPIGVSKRNGRYVAQIAIDGVKHRLGTFASADAAYGAYLQRLADVAPPVRGAA